MLHLSEGRAGERWEPSNIVILFLTPLHWTTRYGLDSPGIEFRRKRSSPHLSRPALLPPTSLAAELHSYTPGKISEV